MPIYEYRCQSCGHELERLQRISDPTLTDCPACGKSQLRRLISAAGFRLKGGGWYETDFKQGNKRNLAESGGSAGNGESGQSGESGKSDSSSKKESSGDGAKESSAPKKDGAKESGASKKKGSSTGTADAA